jgi:hypothetical protein
LTDAEASLTVWIYFSPFIIGDGTVLQFDLFFENFCSKEEVKKINILDKQLFVLNQASKGVKYCSNIQSVRVELLLANILS